jgi:hypothetical protein
VNLSKINLSYFHMTTKFKRRPPLTALELHDGWLESMKREKWGMIK